jgi:hypothetical protein
MAAGRVVMILERTAGGDTPHYLHRDHQSSVVAVSSVLIVMRASRSSLFAIAPPPPREGQRVRQARACQRHQRATLGVALTRS